MGNQYENAMPLRITQETSRAAMTPVVVLGDSMQAVTAEGAGRLDLWDSHTEPRISRFQLISRSSGLGVVSSMVSSGPGGPHAASFRRVSERYPAGTRALASADVITG